MRTTKEIISMRRRSSADVQCIVFARICIEHKLDPCRFADLCAFSRAAFHAGERECNQPNYSGAVSRYRVEECAASMGLSTTWPGLWPQFQTPAGATVRVP